MAHHPARPVPRVGDAIVLKFFEKLQSELGFEPPVIKIYGAGEQIGLQEKDKIDFLIDQNGQHIQHIYATKQVTLKNRTPANTSINASLERGEPQKDGTVAPSLHIDSFKLTDQQNIDPSVALSVMSLLERELVRRADPPVMDEKNLRSLVDAHHQQISNLGNALERVGVRFADARVELEREIDARKSKLSQEHSDALKGLETKFEEKEKQLSEQKEKLEQREKQLDDRDNTHVRRQIRKQFQEHIASFRGRFRLSRDTEQLRIPVHLAVGLIEFACVVLFYIVFSMRGLNSDLWDRIFFSLKTVGITFFAAGTAVWYLRWLTRWSDRHADGEFQLRQLELDMERANWVVETTFEWKNTQNSPIPDPLVESITRNLFAQDSGKSEKDESPVDHLASALLGEASKAKLNIGGNEIEFERSALKKARRAE